MDNDDDLSDLYGGLPEETHSDYVAKIETQLQSLQKQYDDSQALIKELTAEKHTNEKRIKELEKIVEYLKRNMSSLYKTAIAEIKWKDEMLNDLRIQNDELTFRRHNRQTNCDRDRFRDQRINRERHHKDVSPTKEKYKHRIRCKRLANSKSRRDDWERFDFKLEKSPSPERNDHRNGDFYSRVNREKSPSPERNDRHNGDFYSREKYHRSLSKMSDVKERHSTSPRDRIGNSLGTKNDPEMQNEHRSNQNKCSKSQIISSVKHSSEVLTASQFDENEHRSRKDIHLKSQIVSSIKNGSEIQASSRYDKHKHRNSKDTQIKSQIIPSITNCPEEVRTSSKCDINQLRNNKDVQLKSQTFSNLKTGPEVQTSSQCDKNELRSDKDNIMQLKSRTILNVKNGPKTQTTLKYDQNEQRSNEDAHLKSQTISRIQNVAETSSSSQYVMNEHRSQDVLFKSKTIFSSVKNGPEMQPDSQHVKNEHQISRERYPKPQIIPSHMKNRSASKTVAPTDQNKSLSCRIEKPPDVSTIGDNTSQIEKPPSVPTISRIEKSPSVPTIEENNSPTVDTSTVISTKIKKISEPVPDRNKKLNSHAADRLEALFSNEETTSLFNTPYKEKIENHTEDKEKETRSQRNGYHRCEAALLSMKKKSCKLLTPIKDTPDLLKEKFSQIENNKINPVIPMINERRMLSPYKNVAVVEIICKYDKEPESAKPTEPETVTTCSVTISEDIEHGVFSRKSRKRPRIQKTVTNAKKVETC